MTAHDTSLVFVPWPFFFSFFTSLSRMSPVLPREIGCYLLISRECNSCPHVFVSLVSQARCSVWGRTAVLIAKFLFKFSSLHRIAIVCCEISVVFMTDLWPDVIFCTSYVLSWKGRCALHVARSKPIMASRPSFSLSLHISDDLTNRDQIEKQISGSTWNTNQLRDKRTTYHTERRTWACSHSDNQGATDSLQHKSQRAYPPPPPVVWVSSLLSPPPLLSCAWLLGECKIFFLFQWFVD